MSLTPEQRLDKNGRLVTRHVRNGASAPAGSGKIPAPSLPSQKAKKASDSKPKTVQKKYSEIESSYADERLKKVYPFSIFHFTCSDAEAYDVMSVSDSSHTALRLLGAGVRSREDAITFLEQHGLGDLQQDNSEVVDEVIRRGLPAIPTLLAFNEYSVDRKDSPTYYDAVEAQSVRALRETTWSTNGVSHLIWMDRISLADVRAIGATRIKEAERNNISVLDKLKEIHAGTAPYDINMLKRLVSSSEKEYFLRDTVFMADQYGAEFVLGLKHISMAQAMDSNISTHQYSRQQRMEIMKLNDDLRAAGKYLTYEGIIIAYDAGATVQDVVEGLDRGMEISEIAAIKEGIQPSIVSGWL